MVRRVVLALLLVLICIPSGIARAVELKQETITAFNRYIGLTEKQAMATLRETGSYFWIDGFPDAKREAFDAQLRHGEIIVERLETRDGKAPIEVPGGLVHHWVAMCFVPGSTLPETLRVLQDYERYPLIYKGDVKRSRLLSVDGQHFNVFIQMYQKSIITVVYNAEFEVSYFPLGQSRSHSRSYSKRIAEVANPDGSDEGEKPIGRDRGFLWRLYSYWRLEERNGGIYVQLESIALSRRVPAFFAWLVNPLLSSLPKTYLSRILVSTRTALTHGISATASSRAVQERADLVAGLLNLHTAAAKARVLSEKPVPTTCHRHRVLGEQPHCRDENEPCKIPEGLLR